MVNFYIKGEERSCIKNLTLNHKKLKKKKKRKVKTRTEVSRRKEVINIRAEINEVENKKQKK